MGLKAKFTNKPVIDDNGYCNAVLANITLIEADESEFDREQFQFNFTAKGTRKDIKFIVWTGTTINDEKYTPNDRKKAKYNKLTQICLALGAISSEKLREAGKNSNTFELDLSQLKNIPVRFKLTKNQKRLGLHSIDLESLERIETK